MRAEQPDRDGQYHGLHHNYAGNGDTLGVERMPQTEAKIAAITEQK